MLHDSTLHGRSAIVTGAASGIGRATAIALARNAVQVICADRSDPQEAVDTIRAAGGSATACAVDITQHEQVFAMVDLATSLHGGLDIAVNCAGIIDSSPLEDLGRDELEQVLRVNLIGSLTVAQAALAAISDGGRLVLFASVAGRTGGVMSGPSYAASKGGVIAFTKWAARHYAPRGITVNAVAPGPILTAMINDRGYGAEGIPLGRMGQPEELAEAVIFLASEGAAWMTGQTLDVNGGLYMN
jgi:NAD(P)-dependent dehydrogenase (short-subunit alcohol dehydrogenase family)